MDLIKYHELKGLRLYENFITESEEQQLIHFLDSNQCQWNGRGIPPNPELIRRTMQFGAIFSYKLRKIVSEEFDKLPKQFETIFERMLNVKIFKDESCNHVVVNEYDAGQGIMPHCDAPLIFGKTVVALSLLSDCVMSFFDLKSDELLKKIVLPRRSLIVFEGDSRYGMKHYISKDLIETVGDVVIERSRRVSLTCRTVIKSG
jgi:alkylated DNA repair dioxygenase AlkB